VQALSLPEFIEAAGPLIGRKVNKRAKLEELYGLAQSSIALPVAVDSPAIDTFRLQLATSPGWPSSAASSKRRRIGC
jgi:hypothetical protein